MPCSGPRHTVAWDRKSSSVLGTLQHPVSCCASWALAPRSSIVSRPRYRAPSHVDLMPASMSSLTTNLGTPSQSLPSPPSPHSFIQGSDSILLVASDRVVQLTSSPTSPPRFAKFSQHFSTAYLLEAVNEVCSLELSNGDVDQVPEALSGKNAIMYTAGVSTAWPLSCRLMVRWIFGGARSQDQMVAS
jgi:hypothetical protein